jgi:hypothetical protein
LAQFMFEWENPLRCKHCGERFNDRQKFKEHRKGSHV